MKNILIKCITELNSEAPRLDYIRGMLEVLVEQDNTVPVANFIPSGYSELTKGATPKPINPHVNPHGMPDIPQIPGMQILK